MDQDAIDPTEQPIFKISLNRYLQIGFVTSAILVFGLGGWAALANIAGAVVAPGVVVVGSGVKEVQHREGGIVAEIFVSNGDEVQAGDLLVELDDTQTRAGFNLVAGQLSALRARLDRLAAERDKLDTVTFRSSLMNNLSDPNVAEAVASQRGVFRARKATLQGQTAQLNEQLAQLNEQIVGLTAQRDAKVVEIELVTQELSDLRQLLRRDLVPRSRVTSAEREAVRLEGQRGDLVARIATSRGRIAEINTQILQIETEFQNQVLDEISEIQTEVVTLAERNVAADDELRRVDLRAPVDGVIHESIVSTVGGVVAPGATLMYVVPRSDELIVEARVSPIDVDDVAPGQPADVLFSGLPARETPRLHGSVKTVSADRITDEQTGEQYFQAQIALTEDQLSRLGDVELHIGMPADVFIQTGDRTVLNYLVKPLFDAANIAMTES